MSECERCGKLPPIVKTGLFAGSYDSFDYCEDCSENLCDDCLANTECAESPDGKHHGHDEDGEPL
jgi:hypothetical protein